MHADVGSDRHRQPRFRSLRSRVGGSSQLLSDGAAAAVMIHCLGDGGSGGTAHSARIPRLRAGVLQVAVQT